MAGGFAPGQGTGKEYPGSLTLYVTVTCMVAAMGGLIFGYDIGISGIRKIPITKPPTFKPYISCILTIHSILPKVILH